MLQVITDEDATPRRTVIYGPGGIGKTLWAANADRPLFLLTEDGRPHRLVDGRPVAAARLPKCNTLQDVQQQLRQVLTEDHDYRTLVIDSLDQLEPMIWAQVAKDAGKAHLSDIGFGKGYEAAGDDWRKILFVLDKIRDVRGMQVILIGHAKVERFEDPANEAYDRYQLQLHKKAAAEISHWADEILFANYKTFTRKQGEGFNERRVGVGVGDRVIYTTERPSHIAKNRLGLPDELPLEYAALAAYYPAAGAGSPSTSTGSVGAAVQPAASTREGDVGSSAGAPVAAASGAALANNSGTQSGNTAGVAAVGGPSDAATVPGEMAALGFTELDLEDMDASQLRECALLVADHMGLKGRTAFKAAYQKEDLKKMRALITRALNKPDLTDMTGGISNE